MGSVCLSISITECTRSSRLIIQGRAVWVIFSVEANASAISGSGCEITAKGCLAFYEWNCVI